MRCKIVRFQKLMWRNMMNSTKSKKVSVLHYSIDIGLGCQNFRPKCPTEPTLIIIKKKVF